jgi:hypothetical protein
VGRRQDIASWSARWGFAVSVGLAIVVGLLVGATVALPADIPAVALRAAPVYRLEVGGAIFAGLYFAAMSFVLALRNRAFTEVGTGGMRARSLGDLPTSVLNQERSLTVLSELVRKMEDRPDDRGGE